MPRYYFHLRDGADLLLDPEGRLLDGTEAIAAATLAEARAILCADIRQGKLGLDQLIDVEDARGRVVHRLSFIDAVKIHWPVTN